MACILGFLVLGVAFLASRYGLVPSEKETIVSMLGKDVLGENVLYYAYQAATAMVLFLAANTSFADFPRVSAILANDRFMPRQFAFKGDRLAFSRGIVFLAGAASLLLIAFSGDGDEADPAVRRRGLRLLHPLAVGHGEPLAAAAGDGLAHGAWRSTASERR